MAKKSATTTRKRKPAKKVRKAKATNGSTKKAARETMIIASVAENPRRKGTISHKNYEAMVRFIKGKRNVKVADLIAATEYRVQDFNSDLARGHVTVLRSRRG